MLDPMTLTAFAAAALLTAAVGLVWQSRARAGRRQAVLNAYAEREIARQRGEDLRRQRGGVRNAPSRAADGPPVGGTFP